MRQLHKSSLTPTSLPMNWKSNTPMVNNRDNTQRTTIFFSILFTTTRKTQKLHSFFSHQHEIFLFLIVDMKRSKIAWKLKLNQIVETILNSLHPNINIHILLTVLFTFPMVLTRRICLRIRSFLNWWSFPFFSLPLYLIQACSCREKLETSHSLGLKCSWEAS